MAELEGIYFAEFDNTMGPKVTYEAPEGLINPEVFDAISECIIPKPWLFGRMMSTYAFGKTYLGMPVNLEGAQYERNRMLFNVGVVLHPSRRNHSSEVAVYEPVIRKIAQTLEALEAETCFLSDESMKVKLGDVLEKVLTGLRKHSKAVVPIDEANILHLVLNPRQTSQPVPNVREHDVPVPLCDLRRHVASEKDLVLRRIYPCIDGVRFIKQVAEMADVDTELAIECVAGLVCLDLVRLVDIFQYSNIYAATKDVRRIASDPALRDKCLATILDPAVRKTMTTNELFSLYAALRPGLRYEDFCLTRESKLIGVHRHRLITFGLVNGLIRRVLPYPLHLPLPGESNISQLIAQEKMDAQAGNQLKTFELSLMDGKKSLDELCCIVRERGPAELAEAIAAHQRCILVYK
ncbi:hypothetical protein NDN08_003412 [Rhodosorus marinus]|uniref:Nitrogen permease regulator 2 n=1 Tax=Rhodosorus marinus TaxID=101924 RepID=A0AAV8UZ93_9RHOD|nr:hypothetical protein NDN08_003412 [Rhodosorus marinus]